MKILKVNNTNVNSAKYFPCFDLFVFNSKIYGVIKNNSYFSDQIGKDVVNRPFF